MTLKDHVGGSLNPYPSESRSVKVRSIDKRPIPFFI